jgi:hypothetical protein
VNESHLWLGIYLVLLWKTLWVVGRQWQELKLSNGARPAKLVLFRAGLLGAVMLSMLVFHYANLSFGVALLPPILIRSIHCSAWVALIWGAVRVYDHKVTLILTDKMEKLP